MHAFYASGKAKSSGYAIRTCTDARTGTGTEAGNWN